MSTSRIASLVGLVGSLGAFILSLANVLPPKYAGVAMTIGTTLAAFNERIHGGLSTK